MQIVIDIPEKEYRWIKKSDETVFANVASKECMLHAIRNGIPLPEHHGRLIDADALIQELSVVSSRPVKSQLYILRELPTIIEADREGSDEE